MRYAWYVTVFFYLSYMFLNWIVKSSQILYCFFVNILNENKLISIEKNSII